VDISENMIFTQINYKKFITESAAKVHIKPMTFQEILRKVRSAVPNVIDDAIGWLAESLVVMAAQLSISRAGSEFADAAMGAPQMPPYQS
jgi:hypothetical protein